MAGAITLLVRSTAIGMAISLGWYILERVLTRLLTSVFDWFEPVAEYLPMHNLSALTSTNTDLLAVLTGGNNPDTLQASLVLAAWAIALAAVAAVVFRRRDVTGAAGG
jgi:ABC-type transport system involved in multi-copper enzyme maturation permease subunit